MKVSPLFLTLLTGSALASYDHQSTALGTLNLPDTSTYIEVANDTAYLANDLGGFSIVNVANPAAPSLLGVFPSGGAFLGRTYALDWVSDVVYLAAGNTGLVIVDVADPEAPYEASRLAFPLAPTPGNAVALGVTVNGSYAYVCTASRGVKVVNISNPFLPVQVGQYQSADPVRGSYEIAIRGTLAAVANHLDGVRLLDLTNPVAPALLSQYDTPGRTYSVAFQGDYLFAADDTNGLVVLNVSNPAAPVPVTTVPMPGSGAGHLHLSDGMVHVSTFEGGLISFDISNPAVPVVVAKSFTAGTPGGLGFAPGVEGAFVRNGRAYTVWGEDNLRIYDINEASRLQKLHALDFGAAVTTTSAACSGTVAFVAAGSEGLRILNAANPSALAPLASLPATTSTTAVAVRGNRLLVADSSAGLSFVDVTNPAAPAVLGIYDTPGSPAAVTFLTSTRALVADGSGGLLIVDFSVPSAPVLVGSVLTVSPATSVSFSGNLAAAGTVTGVFLFDISLPSAPVPAGSIPLALPAEDVLFWSPSLLCVAAGTDGVRTFDVTTPAASAQVSQYQPGTVTALATAGGYLLAAMGDDGIAVASLADPAQPVTYTANNLTGAAALCADGDLVITASGNFTGTGPREHAAALRLFLPSTPPALTASAGPAGTIDLRFSALPGSSYKLLRSSTLQNWTNWQTVTAGRAPTLISDNITGGSQFYRLENP